MLSTRPTTSSLATKLISAGALREDGVPVLDALLARDTRLIDDGMPIFEQGERPEAIEVIVAGWAIRDRTLSGGRRQTVGILCAGDVCDFNVFLMKRADSGCHAVGPVRVARIGRRALNQLNQHHPAIGQALWWESMAAAAIQREWVANLASRRAEPRIAALLCMLYARMQLAGETAASAMPWPFTQGDLANACGLTVEHCNRSLAALRKRGLVEIRDGRVTFHDPAALARYATFDAAPFHCDPALLPFAEEDVRPHTPTPMISANFAPAA
jgi:CRP-like cAMP-binding protein